MIVLVETLKQSGILLDKLNLLSKGNVIFNYGAGTFIALNLMNNQPASMLFSEILTTTP